MPEAIVSSKGQVTIPKFVRDALNIKVGDKLAFSISPDGAVIINQVNKKVDEVFGMLQREQQPTITVEDMDLAVKQRMRL